MFEGVISMKKLMGSAALVLAMSVSALAAPKVGDLNQYSLVFEVPGQKVEGTVSLKVTGLDAATGKATIEQEVDIMGQKQKSSEVVDAANIAEEQAAQAVQFCEFSGGKREMIAVGGANMETCAFNKVEEGKDVTTYIGAITFGLVKLVTIEQGMTQTLLLKSVTRGQ